MHTPPTLLLLLAACDRNDVHGTIDGQRVLMKDAFFVEEPSAWTDSDRLKVWLVGYRDACETYGAYLTDLDEGTPAVEAWAAHMPPTFWEFEIQARVESLDDVGGELSGIGISDTLDAPGQFEATIDDYRRTLDASYWDSTGAEDDYVLRFATDGGTMRIEGYERGQRFRGEIEADVLDYDLAIVGDVRVEFDATHCPTVEELG